MVHRPSVGSGPTPAPGVVRGQPVGQVVVLYATGPLSDVVAALELALRQALAEEPRGVVCDLHDVRDCTGTGSLRALASAGTHPRDWPMMPVAVALPDARVRDMLRANPLGDYLVVAGTRRLAIEGVMRAPAAARRSLRLMPHRTAPRAARQFVSSALLDHGLDERVPAASTVVSELVTNAVLHAGTEIDLSVAVSDDRCRISVRDLEPAPPQRPASPGTLHGRGLTIVEGLSTARGVLPTSVGGKVVWAVLADALASSMSSCVTPSAPV